MDTALQIKLATLIAYIATAAALVVLLAEPGGGHALAAAGRFG